MDDFREETALRQTVAAMGNAAAEWIKQSAEERKRLLERIDRLEVVIYGLRRMAESGCALKDIIDACEAELPEAMPKNGE